MNLIIILILIGLPVTLVILDIVRAQTYRIQGGAKLPRRRSDDYTDSQPPRHPKQRLNPDCETMIGPCTCGAWHEQSEAEELEALKPKTPVLKFIKGGK